MKLRPALAIRSVQSILLARGVEHIETHKCRMTMSLFGIIDEVDLHNRRVIEWERCVMGLDGREGGW